MRQVTYHSYESVETGNLPLLWTSGNSWLTTHMIQLKQVTYHSYEPVESESCRGVVSAIVKWGNLIMLPWIISLLEKFSSGGVKSSNWLKWIYHHILIYKAFISEVSLISLYIYQVVNTLYPLTNVTPLYIKTMRCGI